MENKKTFQAPMELKSDGEEGTFRAVFSRFGVVDHDKDVTMPGAFVDGQEVVLEGWGHDYYDLPPGKGVIHTDEEKTWIDGQFFLDTSRGRDHYNTLKNLDGLEEWSYTFAVKESRLGEFDGEEVRFLESLDPWGVSPVTRGAGIDTRTVMLKEKRDSEFTAEEIEQLRELLKSDEAEVEVDVEEEAEDEVGEVSPAVILAQVDVSLLEE